MEDNAHNEVNFEDRAQSKQTLMLVVTCSPKVLKTQKFKVCTTTRLGKVFEKYFERFGIENRDSVKFFYSSQELGASQTPNECGMEDNARIKVKFEDRAQSKQMLNLVFTCSPKVLKPVNFKVCTTTRLGKVFEKYFEKYFERFGIKNRDSVKFLYSSQELGASQTPNECGMEDNARIEVKFEDGVPGVFTDNINFTIKGPAGSLIKFKVRATTLFERVFACYRQRHGIEDEDAIKFSFNGNIIEPSNTWFHSNVDKDAVIEAHFQLETGETVQQDLAPPALFEDLPSLCELSLAEVQLLPFQTLAQVLNARGIEVDLTADPWVFADGADGDGGDAAVPDEGAIGQDPFSIRDRRFDGRGKRDLQLRVQTLRSADLRARTKLALFLCWQRLSRERGLDHSFPADLAVRVADEAHALAQANELQKTPAEISDRIKARLDRMGFRVASRFVPAVDEEGEGHYEWIGHKRCYKTGNDVLF